MPPLVANATQSRRLKPNTNHRFKMLGKMPPKGRHYGTPIAKLIETRQPPSVKANAKLGERRVGLSSRRRYSQNCSAWHAVCAARPELLVWRLSRSRSRPSAAGGEVLNFGIVSMFTGRSVPRGSFTSPECPLKRWNSKSVRGSASLRTVGRQLARCCTVGSCTCFWHRPFPSINQPDALDFSMGPKSSIPAF